MPASSLELSISQVPQPVISVVLSFKPEVSCVLEASCLWPGRFQRSGAGEVVAGEGFPGGPAPRIWVEGTVSYLPLVPGMNFCVYSVSVGLGRNEWGGALSCLGS